MSDDIKRKEFLDELFTFMQKRGKLVTSYLYTYSTKKGNDLLYTVK